MKPVDTPHGCNGDLSAPITHWSYDAEGRLIGAPHFDEGFPGLQKQELGLDRFARLSTPVHMGVDRKRSDSRTNTGTPTAHFIQTYA